LGSCIIADSYPDVTLAKTGDIDNDSELVHRLE